MVLDFGIDDDGKSEIQQTFDDTTIFITGATGFLGKLLLEKLLRGCHGIKKIYILVRTKKQDYTKRLDTLFEEFVFNDIKINSKHILQKVCIMCGDLFKPNLGLSEQDQKVIISEVDFIFHVAATTRFDEKIRTAAYINIRATWDLLKLAQQGPKSKVFVHVSTAYVFPMVKDFTEVWYETQMKAEDLFDLVDATDETLLENMTPSLLGEWPNTYTFTKAIAEDLIYRHAGKLRYAIVRPSVVVSTSKEPIAGWIDTFTGVTGLFVGIELGVIHTIQTDYNRNMDIVPADYVINNMISVAWYSKAKQINGIYNYVNQTQNPISFCKVDSICERQTVKIPSVHKKWHRFKVITNNYYTFMVLHYILHICKGYIIDFGCKLAGKPTFAVKTYSRVTKQLLLLNYFTRCETNFSNTNSQQLWKSLSARDKLLFNFDMAAHDWEKYSEDFINGIRVYLLKDPLDTIPQAKKLQTKLAIVHYTLVAMLLLLLLMFLSLLIYVI